MSELDSQYHSQPPSHAEPEAAFPDQSDKAAKLTYLRKHNAKICRKIESNQEFYFQHLNLADSVFPPEFRHVLNDLRKVPTKSVEDQEIFDILSPLEILFQKMKTAAKLQQNKEKAKERDQNKADKDKREKKDKKERQDKAERSGKNDSKSDKKQPEKADKSDKSDKSDRNEKLQLLNTHPALSHLPQTPIDSINDAKALNEWCPAVTRRTYNNMVVQKKLGQLNATDLILFEALRSRVAQYSARQAKLPPKGSESGNVKEKEQRGSKSDKNKPPQRTASSEEPLTETYSDDDELFGAFFIPSADVNLAFHPPAQSPIQHPSPFTTDLPAIDSLTPVTPHISTQILSSYLERLIRLEDSLKEAEGKIKQQQFLLVQVQEHNAQLQEELQRERGATKVLHAAVESTRRDFAQTLLLVNTLDTQVSQLRQRSQLPPTIPQPRVFQG